MNKIYFVVSFLILSILTFSSETPTTADSLGFLTLLPPLVAIALAFITKNVITSLFIGIFTGTFLLNIHDTNIFSALNKGFLDIVSSIISSMADSWNAGIILQVLTIGGLVALVSKMGGAKAVAEALAKRAKSPVSTQIITWILGIFIFFDDYANSLIVGPIMRPISDKMSISREKLAFLVDATAAPIAGIALVSTWVGYEVSLIKDGFASIGLEGINAYGIFMETIPYRFYNILMLCFVFFTAYFLREFGPMYRAEQRARLTGQLLEPGAQPMANSESEEFQPDERTKLSIWNALIPIGILITASFVGFYFNGLSYLEGEVLSRVHDAPISFYAIRETFGASDASIVLFQAALLASIVAAVMGVSQKMFKFAEALEIWMGGMKSLVITGVILLLAWSLSSVIKELGTSAYLVSLLSDSVPKFILPSIIFILGSIISFSTGTSYGTMGILMPLTIPLANAVGINSGLAGSELYSFIIMNVSAVLTGAILGDHCSPISDTTILSSMGTSCDHVDHTRTQLFYAVVVGIISVIFGYLPVGLGISIWAVLPGSIISILLIVRFIGKPVESLETASEAQIA